jgi:hypothetical protein
LELGFSILARIPQLKSERGANLEQRRHSTVSFKVFFGAGSQLHLLNAVTQRTDNCRLLIYESFVKVAVSFRIQQSSNVSEQTYSRRPYF